MGRPLRWGNGFLEARTGYVAALAISLLLGCAPSTSGTKDPAKLKESLQATDADERTKAANALGKMGPASAEAVDALAAKMSDPELRVRIEAAVALGQIGSAAANAVPALSKALNDADGLLRRQSVIALGKIGPAAKSALPALEKLRRDPTPMVRKAVDEAIPLIKTGTTK